MNRKSPQRQLRDELSKLSEQDQEDLCIAIVAYLRFGIRKQLIRLISY